MRRETSQAPSVRASVRAAARVSAVAVLLACCMALSGCFLDTTSLVNLQTFDTTEVTSITVSYSSENITVYQSSSDELVLKEYMSKDISDRYAVTTQEDGCISISEGDRPSDAGFQSYVELYVPESWSGDISFVTDAGYVRVIPDIQVKSLEITTVSGSISLPAVTANTVTISTKSGTVKASKLDAKVSCTSETGSVEVTEILGSGDFQSKSGKISAGFAAVEGDISITSQTGRITCMLPQVSCFDLRALTKDGYIRLPFPSSETLEVDTFAYKVVYAMVGDYRIHDIQLETRTGAIYVQYYGYYNS